jgi:ABC-2 type transport system ATP-binding protein
VAGDDGGLEQVISSVAGVTRVINAANGYEFETQPGKDVRPEVARAIITAGYDLLELRPMGASLEEVFMELTRDEPDLPSHPEENEYLDAHVEQPLGG